MVYRVTPSWKLVLSFTGEVKYWKLRPWDLNVSIITPLTWLYIYMLNIYWHLFLGYNILVWTDVGKLFQNSSSTRGISASGLNPNRGSSTTQRRRNTRNDDDDDDEVDRVKKKIKSKTQAKSKTQTKTKTKTSKQSKRWKYRFVDVSNSIKFMLTRGVFLLHVKVWPATTKVLPKLQSAKSLQIDFAPAASNSKVTNFHEVIIRIIS